MARIRKHSAEPRWKREQRASREPLRRSGYVKTASQIGKRIILECKDGSTIEWVQRGNTYFRKEDKQHRSTTTRYTTYSGRSTTRYVRIPIQSVDRPFPLYTKEETVKMTRIEFIAYLKRLGIKNAESF